MDEYLAGFVLGVFVSGLGFVALGACIGLICATILTMQKTDRGINIVLYAIETITPLSVVVALVWANSDMSYNFIALWVGVGVMVMAMALILFNKTPNGPLLMVIWKSFKDEMARGRIKNGAKIY